jgi:ABC-type lipoprotein export system ATPase subunit
MVTHSADVAAGASRVMLMRDGRIVDDNGAVAGEDTAVLPAALEELTP